MAPKTHIAIRAYDLAVRAIHAVREDGTPEARHILKYLLGPKERAERKAVRGPANPDKEEWEKAYKKAMDALSTYIRTRDTKPFGDGRYGYCCTCQTKTLKKFSELGDGHWQSTKHWGTKFHLFNNHAQCWGCNSKMMGNGRPKEHEDYIRLVHGPEWPAKLIFLTKTDKREKTTKELLAIAEDLQNRTAQHLAREASND